MGDSLKKLAGETVIYGASTILGRLFNWLLTPFYTWIITQSELGVIIRLYGFVAILLVLFTYGLETGFFRFSRGSDRNNVFKTSLCMLAITSSFLIFITLVSATPLSNLLFDGQYRDALVMLGIIVALDAFISIPFANLRLQNKAIKFGIIKLVNIGLNLSFNLIFLLLIPYLIKKEILPQSLVEIYNRGNAVFYIVLSNLIASISVFFFFAGDFKNLSGKFDLNLAARSLKYTFPVLIVGLTGMVIQNIDSQLIPILVKENGDIQLSIYGTAFKIGVLMSLFTQSFRFAFEPYFFKSRDTGKDAYAKIMEYFVFFGILIFLGVTIFIDVIYLIVKSNYYEGKVLVPLILIGFLFFGIYYNLSLWYKLTDKTKWGSFFGITGMIITVVLNFILLPRIGIFGSALALVAGYLVMMLLSYFKGQKVYYVPYNLKRIGLYLLAGILIYFIDSLVSFDVKIYSFIFKALIFVSYILFFVWMERNDYIGNIVKKMFKIR